MTIYTIGHSNHRIETFTGLLQQHGIQHLVDVRSKPWSRWPHFTKRALAGILRAASIHYLHEPSLGGKPELPAPTRRYRLQSIAEKFAPEPICLMCSEGDPKQCHRHYLLEADMRGLGYEVRHILRDGSLQTLEPPPRESDGQSYLPF